MWEGLLQAFQAALHFFFQISGNYGVAIILLTLAVRVLLWPLTYSQVVSARRMQALQPEMERLRQKYKNDQQRLNQEVVKLWREQKVNPASGCLPLVIQLPILWAMYQVLLKAPEFKGAHFLWIDNLAAADRLFVLPALAAVTTFVQMWMTTPRGGTQQPAQQMMLWTMPAFVGFITVSLPAGISLYWVVGNLISILQQYLVPAGKVAEGGSRSA